MPFTHYRTQGIFLRKENRGEADQLLTVFTKDFGKIEVLARAIRKITSKLRSGAEIFYLSEVEFIQGKTHKTLTDAVLIDKFKNLRENPQKLEITYQITDALASLTAREERDLKVWHLLSKTFQKIENCKIEDFTPTRNEVSAAGYKLKTIYYYFLWNFFSLLGYKPELYCCPVCQKKLLPETFWFSAKEGGVVCWQCFAGLAALDKGKEEAKEISVDTVKILRIFFKEGWHVLEKLKIESKIQENLKEISASYLSFLKEDFSKAEK